MSTTTIPTPQPMLTDHQVADKSTRADMNMENWLAGQVACEFEFGTSDKLAQDIIELVVENFQADRQAGYTRNRAKERALRLISKRLDDTVRQPGFLTPDQLDAMSHEARKHLPPTLPRTTDVFES